LRGAPVRDPLNWSKHIGAALYRSGLEAEVMFASHQNEIHNVYEIPKGLPNKWFCRGYHGSPQHNSRGVIQRYLGFWDCNPVNLIPLSPRDSAPLYVEMMGGPDRIMARGRLIARRREIPDGLRNREQACAGRPEYPPR
jgi:alkyl sulfatase BDS1-like metallo-beta-lactamase superfamily hydrolase